MKMSEKSWRASLKGHLSSTIKTLFKLGISKKEINYITKKTLGEMK